jgi:DNA-binding transcriptional LysR family regulator
LLRLSLSNTNLIKMAHSSSTRARWLKLRHLEVLLAIARAGSLTAAAELLHMSQPAVSQWLADIEAALGVPLFLRGRRLRPTPYADAVLRHAERTLGDTQRLQQEIAAIRGGAVGLVRIGTMMAGASGLLPSVVRRIRRDDSMVRMVVVEDIAAGLWSRFERNEIDLILGRLDEHALGSAYMREALYQDPYRVICGPQHLLARRRRLTWADTMRFPWIMPPSPTRLRQAIEATFTKQGLALPEVWLDSVSFTTNQVLLQETECLSVLSHSAARYYKSLKLLQELPLELTVNIGDVGMVWSDPRPGPALLRVLDALREESRRMLA